MTNKHDHNHSSCCSHNATHGCEQTLDEIKFENSLHGACVYGDIEKAKKFILKMSYGDLISEINKQDSSGYTALHYAVRSGNYEICKLLINSKANVNLKTKSCLSTPLHRAAYMCHERIIELLLINGANAFEQDCDGKTALHKCVENNNRSYEKSAKLLLKHSPSLLSVKDKYAKTAIDYCQSLKDLDYNA